jgi:hypothetical protein
MADTKITALTAITTVDPAVDVLPIVDISDTTMAASGTTKKITSNQILGAGGTATLASATITGDLTVDTSTLKVDSANNRVGIGTASPAAPVDVQGSSLRLQLQSSSNGGYATWKYIGKNSSGTAVNFEQGLNIAADNAFELYDNQNTQLVSRYVSGVSGAHSWFLTGSTAMTLNSTGLGIGVTPSAWGSSFKPVQIGSGTVSSAFVGQTNSPVARIMTNSYFDGTNFVKVQNNTAGMYVLQNNAHEWHNAVTGTGTFTFTQAMTLTANGQLLLGTSSTSGAVDIGMVMNKPSATGFVGNVYQLNSVDKAYTYIASATAALRIDTVAGYTVNVISGGTNGVYLANGGVAWLALSDERFKDIIEPISNAVAKVGSLRSVIGKFKTDSEGTRRPFLFAQDVQAVLPEAVDATKPEQLGLSYTEVIPLLVAAIQELTAEVNALKNA